jgi:hypothetical protein
MRIKVIADSHINGLLHLRHERSRDFWNRVRPDAGLEQHPVSLKRRAHMTKIVLLAHTRT